MKLKPCPFCGGNAAIEKTRPLDKDAREGFYAYCTKCECELGKGTYGYDCEEHGYYEKEEAASIMWNKRYEPKP